MTESMRLLSDQIKPKLVTFCFFLYNNTWLTYELVLNKKTFLD